MPLGLCSPLLAFKIFAQYSSSDNLLWKIPRAKLCWIACLHIHSFNVLEQPLLYYAKSHYWFFVVGGGGFFNATIKYSCSKITILCTKNATVIVTIFFASHSCLYDFVVVVVSCFLFWFFALISPSLHHLHQPASSPCALNRHLLLESDAFINWIMILPFSVINLCALIHNFNKARLCSSVDKISYGYKLNDEYLCSLQVHVAVCVAEKGRNLAGTTIGSAFLNKCPLLAQVGFKTWMAAQTWTELQYV